MKKQSNPPPENAVKPNTPGAPPQTRTLTIGQMAAVFDEWATRYAKDPTTFTDILDADGNAVADYGECCAHYFKKLSAEMENDGLLPV